MTNVREIEDGDELNRRRELVESKSPAELSEFNGLGDFPVPTRIQNIFKNSGAKDETTSEIAVPKNFSGKCINCLLIFQTRGKSLLESCGTTFLSD